MFNNYRSIPPQRHSQTWRIESLLGKVNNETQEPLRGYIISDLTLLLKFWTTYSSANEFTIENANEMILISILCVKGYPSYHIAEEYEIDKAIVDRIFWRVNKLLKLLISRKYQDFITLDDDLEFTDEEFRIFRIFSTFRTIPTRVLAMRSIYPDFDTLCKFNPHYIDILNIVGSGNNLPSMLRNAGIKLSKPKAQSISYSLISALIYSKFVKASYPDIEAFFIAQILRDYIQNDYIVQTIKRGFELAVNVSTSEFQDTTYVKRFIEFLPYIDGNIMNGSNGQSGNKSITNIVDNHFKSHKNEDRFVSLLIRILRSYLENRSLDQLTTKIENTQIFYSSKYIKASLKAGFNLIISCTLAAISSSDNLTDEDILNWANRCRPKDCATILKKLCGEEQ